MIHFIKNSKAVQIVPIILLAMLLVCTLSNLLLPPSSFFHVSNYTIGLLGKYLSFALLALALDLVWGYLGILSLGHGIFFGLGAYVMGMYLALQIGERGVYGNALLPDFMVFLNWETLPWYWGASRSLPVSLLLIGLIPGIFAFFIAYMVFRSRIQGVYLSIITQALTYALMLAFYRNEMGFGGNNGLTDFKDITGFSLQAPQVRLFLFFLTGLFLIGAYLLTHWVTHSKLGLVCQAIRDEENKARFIGHNVDQFKIFIFILSAVLASIAGALYTPQVGIVTPSLFAPLFSIEIVIWVAIGGRNTLYGAIIGAILVNYIKTYFTISLPDFWLYALGLTFVSVTILLPKGVGPLLAMLKKNKTHEHV